MVDNKVIFFNNDQANIYDNESEAWLKSYTPSQARYALEIAIVNKKAIFFGGAYDRYNKYSSLVDIYDGKAKTKNEEWTVHDTNEARRSPAVAIVNSKAIFFGGIKSENDPIFSSQIDIYDDKATGKKWSTYNTREARREIAVAVVDKKAIFFGGWKKPFQYSSQVDIYDDEADEGKKWTTHTTSEARTNVKVVVIGKKAIFFGGEKGDNQYSSQVDIYDDEADEGKKWTTHTASEARSSVAVSVVGKKAIFFGGEKSNQYSTQVDIYDDEADEGKKWNTHTTSEGRTDAKVVVIGKKAIFFGGWLSSQVDIYDDEETNENKKWKIHTFIEKLGVADVAIVGKKAIFFGSWLGSGYSKKIYIYDSEKDNDKEG